MYLKLKKDFKKIVKDLELQDKKLIARARQAALRKTGAKVRVKALKNTASEVGIQQKFLRRRIKVYSHPRFKKIAVWFGFKPIPAIEVVGKMSARASARFMSRFTGSPFMATMPSGHVGFFARYPKTRKRKQNEKGDYPQHPIGEVMVHYEKQGRRNLERAGDQIGPPAFKFFFPKEIERQLNKNRQYAR